jgi:hypothetical protein
VVILAITSAISTMLRSMVAVLEPGAAAPR